jgi:hypothetical protein
MRRKRKENMEGKIGRKREEGKGRERLQCSF